MPEIVMPTNIGTQTRQVRMQLHVKGSLNGNHWQSLCQWFAHCPVAIQHGGYQQFASYCSASLLVIDRQCVSTLVWAHRIQNQNWT